MRHVLTGTLAAAAFALGLSAASAQTVAPVPNASGSQVTNPAGTDATGNMNYQKVPMPGETTGSVAPVPNGSGSQTTNPAGTGSTANQNYQKLPMPGGAYGSPPPAPNASGSLTTNPQ